MKSCVKVRSSDLCWVMLRKRKQLVIAAFIILRSMWLRRQHISQQLQLSIQCIYPTSSDLQPGHVRPRQYSIEVSWHFPPSTTTYCNSASDDHSASVIRQSTNDATPNPQAIWLVEQDGSYLVIFYPMTCHPVWSWQNIFHQQLQPLGIVDVPKCRCLSFWTAICSSLGCNSNALLVWLDFANSPEDNGHLWWQELTTHTHTLFIAKM